MSGREYEDEYEDELDRMRAQRKKRGGDRNRNSVSAGTVRQSGPVYRNQKTAGAASVAAGRYIIPLDAGFGGLLEHQISGAVRNRDLYRQRNVRV